MLQFFWIMVQILCVKELWNLDCRVLEFKPITLYMLNRYYILLMVYITFCFLRQSLTIYPRLAPKSQFPCFCFSCTGISGLHQDTWCWLRSLYQWCYLDNCVHANIPSASIYLYIIKIIEIFNRATENLKRFFMIVHVYIHLFFHSQILLPMRNQDCNTFFCT